ncbi:MAG: PRC-barrel domain-containing protein, partial [Caldimonas sp.]
MALVFGRFECLETQGRRPGSAISPEDVDRADVELLDQARPQRNQGVVPAHPVGHVKDFYFDDEEWVVRYLVVDTGGWLSSRKVL